MSVLRASRDRCRRRCAGLALILLTVGLEPARAQPPSPVTGLTASRVGQAIHLSWNANPAGLGSFEVERTVRINLRSLFTANPPPLAPGPGPIGPITVTPAPPGTTVPPAATVIGRVVVAGPSPFTYQDVNVEPGVTYCYRIVPRLLGGAAATASAEVCHELRGPCQAAQLLPVTLVAPPTSSCAVRGKPVTLSWAAPVGTDFVILVLGTSVGVPPRHTVRNTLIEDRAVLPPTTQLRGGSVSWRPTVEGKGTLTLNAFDQAGCKIGTGSAGLQVLRPGSLSIGGRILLGGASPLEGVAVQLVPSTGPTQFRKTAAPFGTYSFDGLDPGSYTVIVPSPQKLLNSQTYSFSPTTQSVTLGCTSRDTLNFVGS